MTSAIERPPPSNSPIESPPRSAESSHISSETNQPTNAGPLRTPGRQVRRNISQSPTRPSRIPRPSHSGLLPSSHLHSHRSAQPFTRPTNMQYFGATALQISSKQNKQILESSPTRQCAASGQQLVSPKIVYGTVPVGRTSVYTVCPYCGSDIYTIVEYQTTWKTHLFVFFLLFITLFLSLLIYCAKCAKDVAHYCPKCGRYLGTRAI